jgi:predicted dehydrogenase
MSSKVRIGVVGTSWYADFMYFPNLHGYPTAELAAVCGRNRARTEELAAKYSIPQVYTDYREMMTGGGLDAVIIVAPDDLHYPMTLEALNAGLHVLCDKPLALKAEHAREMYARARAARVNHMVLFTYRSMPFFRYVRDLIEQGYVGRCYHCEFRFLMGFSREPVYRWRFDQSRANGSLGDSGSHMADLARWLVGDIVRVQATLGTHVARPGAEAGQPLDPANDTALLLVEFANGAQGTIQVSSVAHVADDEMRQSIYLYGADGSLEVDVSHWGADDWVSIRGARGQDDVLGRCQPLRPILGFRDALGRWPRLRRRHR